MYLLKCYEKLFLGCLLHVNNLCKDWLKSFEKENLEKLKKNPKKFIRHGFLENSFGQRNKKKKKRENAKAMFGSVVLFFHLENHFTCNFVAHKDTVVSFFSGKLTTP